MKYPNAIAFLIVALSLVAAPAATAADPAKPRGDKMMNMDRMMSMEEFMKSCDMDHDGMMSKAEMVKHMEKMFDRMDARKAGKLDKKQTQEFLKQLMAPSGA